MANNARIVHAKTARATTGSDTQRVYGTDWNADHVLTGLENVDNTSDATKDAATATLTNKTIDTAGPNTIKINGNTLAATAGTATITIPNSTDTLVGKATTDTLTNKTLTAPTITGATITTSTYNGNTWTAGTGTLTIAAGKTLTASDTATVSGTNTGDQTITLTGDVTGTGTGSFAATIGATKVTSAMLNADVFSTAHTWAGQQTFVAPILGTPASGTLTNATGLPVSTGVSGLGTGVATALGINVGTAGAPVVNGGALGTPSSGTATNLTGTASGLTAGNVTTNANLTGDVTSVGNATTIGANKVTNAMRSTMAAYTLKGNATGSTANEADIDVTALTAKASPVSADIVLIQDSAASNAFKKTTVGALASAGSVSSLNGQTGALTSYFPPQGRLTLATGTPVMTTTQSAKTTLYYTPYVGNMIPLYDGTNMVPVAFSELSVATTDTTKNPAAVGASKVNDWFVWNDAGTLRLSHGPDWTSDTARSAGTALSMVNGILLNAVAITNGPAASRGTYVGTTRSNGSSQLDWILGSSAVGGGQAWLGVWNMYNRRTAEVFVQNSTATWNYTTAAWRAANNSSGLSINIVRGQNDDGVRASYGALFVANGSSAQMGISIGLDSSTAIAATATSFTTFFSVAANNQIAGVATYSGYPGFGFHYLQAIEYGATNGIFSGVNGITSCGLTASVLC